MSLMCTKTLLRDILLVHMKIYKIYLKPPISTHSNGNALVRLVSIFYRTRRIEIFFKWRGSWILDLHTYTYYYEYILHDTTQYMRVHRMEIQLADEEKTIKAIKWKPLE